MFNRKEANVAGTSVTDPVNDATPAIETLRENVVGLAHDLKAAGNDKAHKALDYMNDGADSLRASGSDALAKIERRVRAKPGQSLGIAFAVGIIASLFLTRRS